MGEDLSIHLPNEVEAERERAFKVIKNYLVSISEHLVDLYSPPERVLGNMVHAQRSLRFYSRLRQRDLEPELIRKYLTLSWAGELQMRLGSTLDWSTLRYSNAWAPVHAYYAIYMALQAWFAVNGMHLVEDHTKSLNAISNMIQNRQLFPPPLATICSGCPELGSTVFHGVPLGEDVEAHVELLSNPVKATFWPRYAKMLSVTRQRRLARNFNEWKKREGRQRMSRDQKARIASRLPATTIFDFFWRLRIRSNYRDVSSYLTWNVSDQEHWEFNESLTQITTTVCGLIESLLIGVGAAELYDDLVTKFLEGSRGVSPQSIGFLENRRSVLLSTPEE